MSQTRSARISIINHTGGNALIQAYHRNTRHGIQCAAWLAEPGQSVGPLAVTFETGLDALGIFDHWAVVVHVKDGPRPGIYSNAGSALEPGWQHCQLHRADGDASLTFRVDLDHLHLDTSTGTCTDPMVYRRPYASVANVFVLMLENRSFDNLFAFSGIPGITVATTGDANTYDGQTYPVVQGAPTTMPGDPGHEFEDVVEQLCGPGQTFSKGRPYPARDNSGFAANFATAHTHGEPRQPEDIGQIMSCFHTPQQLPVIHQLAAEFAVCDHWFSSLPGPTWPNRYFAHGASSAGLDDSPSMADIFKWETVSGFTYPNGSIFDALARRNLEYKLYIDNHGDFSDRPSGVDGGGGVPHVASLKGIDFLDVDTIRNLEPELHNPYLSAYTFIEPNYGDLRNNTYEGGSSQHPLDNMYGGESLIKFVYEAIRNSPIWETSLLVITYDEHGGFYDSVSPPSASPPDDKPPPELNKHGFEFDTYGVRVPAVVISPLIPRGKVSSAVYDHATVCKTLEELYNMRPLTGRDREANSVLPILSLASPRSDCPARLRDPAPDSQVPPARPYDPSAPLPESGNLVGTLAILLGAELQLAGGTEVDRQVILARFKTMRTLGDAQAYIARVTALIEAARAARARAVAARSGE